MYHCNVCFYLTGRPCSTFESIKEILPFEHFTHEFFESEELEIEQAARADVILANLTERDVQKAVRMLIEVKKEEAELIVLAGKEQLEALDEYPDEVSDVWYFPMTGTEESFRFRRWQQKYKKEIGRAHV